MSIIKLFKSISIDNELVKQLNKKKHERVKKYNQIHNILTNITYYNILGVVSKGANRYNEIAENIGVKRNNLSVHTSILTGGYINSKVRCRFLRKKVYSHKNRKYFIDYKGILKFIAEEMLEIPFVFKRSVNNQILKQFREFFDNSIVKYYSLNELFNLFIYRMSYRGEKLKLKEFETPKNIFGNLGLMELNESVIKLRSSETLKSLQKDYSTEELFYLACMQYVREKIVIF